MSELISKTEEFNHCIGTVYGFNVLTRELEVYIPKLMPGIIEGQDKKNISTNLDLDINYQKHLTTASTIRAKARDMNEPLPDIGSKVMIFFIDENILFPIWEKLNLAGEYKVIDEEKYKKLYSLQIGDMITDVYEDDNITINIPSNFKVIKDFDNKNKTFNIVESKEISDRLSILEEIIGNMTTSSIDSKNNILVQRSSGIYKRLEELELKLKMTENELYQLKLNLDKDEQYRINYKLVNNSVASGTGRFRIVGNSDSEYYTIEITEATWNGNAANPLSVGKTLYINTTVLGQPYDSNIWVPLYSDKNGTETDTLIEIIELINSTQ